jgi:hypothetical protein
MMPVRESSHPGAGGRFSLSLATILLIAASCVGCGSSGTAPAISPQPTVNGDVHSHLIAGRDVALLGRQGYSVNTTLTTGLPDGTVLYVFRSICTGSADGHCQAVDAFRGDSTKAIWHRQYIGVRGVRSVPKGFSVTATSYAAQDPLCCPSLPDVTDIYTWNGSGFTEHGPLPRSPVS